MMLFPENYPDFFEQKMFHQSIRVIAKLSIFFFQGIVYSLGKFTRKFELSAYILIFKKQNVKIELFANIKCCLV